MTDATQLEDGFYWVRFIGDREWTLSAKYDGELVYALNGEYINEDHIDEIDPRPIKREE